MSNYFITTTQLREQSSKLIQSPLSGKSVNLIYRSKIVGKIDPVSLSEKTIDDTELLKKLFYTLKSKNLIPKKLRKQAYRKHLKEKYGQNFS